MLFRSERGDDPLVERAHFLLVQRIVAALADDVRYLGSVLIREDEVVLCHFEGTADAIRGVAKRARVPYERLLAATHTLP